MTPLTSIQQAVLSYIRQCVSDRGYPPSIREVADYLGVTSSSTAYSHVQALKRKGYIEIVPGSPRAIRICEVP